MSTTDAAFSAMLSALYEVSEHLDGFVDVIDGGRRPQQHGRGGW